MEVALKEDITVEDMCMHIDQDRIIIGMCVRFKHTFPTSLN